MSTNGDYLNHLTLYHYAAEAFCFDPNEPSGYGQGGIYAGTTSEFASPNDKPMPARARLVKIAPGKLFVRWADSKALEMGELGWHEAAGGAWWSSDRGADQIVQETVARSRGSSHGDSSPVAREFSNVGYTSADGSYRSNMGAVVVCRTRFPITVLVGVGRPVINRTRTANGSFQLVELPGEELQVVMMTRWRDRKVPDSEADWRKRLPFRGTEFLEKVFFGSSSQLTHWWCNEDPVGKRRSAARKR
jgi:hypothetical protein